MALYCGDNWEDARFALLIGSETFINSCEEGVPNLPLKTVLHQNRPNPFNPSTIIRYESAQAGHVTLRIYDVNGALVKILEDRDRPAGRYEVGWNGENERGERLTGDHQVDSHGLRNAIHCVRLKRSLLSAG
jgi:hypothetical protein